MSNLSVLIRGELERMKKYHIMGASLLVAFIWIGVLHFSGLQDVTGIFPLLLFLDSTSMALLMVGVTMFFEKQEGVIKTLLVSPIGKGEYILAKTLANIVSNIITLAVLYIYARLFREINVNIAMLLAVVFLVSFVHSLIGFLLTFYSKDFTALLMGMMKYAFIFMIPVVLDQIGFISNEVVGKLLYIIPTKASMTLFTASASRVETWEVVLSASYLVIASGLLFYIVYKMFDQFAIKESGV